MRWLLLACVLIVGGQAIAQNATPERRGAFVDLEKCYIHNALFLDDGRSDPITVARAILSMCHSERKKLVHDLLGMLSNDARIADALSARREQDIDQAASVVLIARRKPTNP